MRGFWVEYRESWTAVAALAVVALVVSAALLAPWITPQDPYDLANLDLLDARRPPGFVGSGGYTHLLGTDAQGRDLFSAILYGLRISLQMGLAAGAVALAIGTTLGILAAERLLTRDMPSAVFCGNDMLAFGVFRGLAQAGVRVPEDVSLVGYDDITFAADWIVPLTSVRQPSYELGYRAASLLLEHSSGDPSHVHQKVVLPPSLVVRASSGPRTP